MPKQKAQPKAAASKVVDTDENNLFADAFADVKDRDANRPTLKLCQNTTKNAGKIGRGKFFIDENTVFEKPIVQYVAYRHGFFVNEESTDGSGKLLASYDYDDAHNRVIRWDDKANKGKGGYVCADFPKATVSENYVFLFLIQINGEWKPVTMYFSRTATKAAKVLLTAVKSRTSQLFQLASIEYDRYFGILVTPISVKELPAAAVKSLKEVGAEIAVERATFSRPQISHASEAPAGGSAFDEE